MFEQLADILNQKNGTLVVVSKTQTKAAILEVYNKGHRIFGENRVQELVQKYEELPKDIQWHLIGHLQRNKVKFVAPFVQLIHSVDSLKLLKEIDKQGALNERVIDCLLQVKIASEESKFGLSFQDAESILKSSDYTRLKNVRIVGVMGMATFTADEQMVRTEFRKLKSFFDYLKGQYFSEQPSFKEISMGMSGDYKIALEEGSNMVRVGSLIFGPRS